MLPKVKVFGIDLLSPSSDLLIITVISSLELPLTFD